MNTKTPTYVNSVRSISEFYMYLVRLSQAIRKCRPDIDEELLRKKVLEISEKDIVKTRGVLEYLYNNRAMKNKPMPWETEEGRKKNDKTWW